MCDLDYIMGDPMKQIDELFEGIGILRKAETEQADTRPSPEYREAFELLETRAEYMTGSDGSDELALTIGAAADLIADNYERRES